VDYPFWHALVKALYLKNESHTECLKIYSNPTPMASPNAAKIFFMIYVSVDDRVIRQRRLLLSGYGIARWHCSIIKQKMSKFESLF
jgi:hypothetical protein